MPRALPEKITEATKAATLSPMITLVATGSPARRTGTVRWAPLFRQPGQWKPTEADVMHEGQIGLSQRWQATAAARSGCRVQVAVASMGRSSLAQRRSRRPSAATPS